MSAPELSRKLSLALDEATERYSQQNPTSKSLHEEATKSLPGGNTRTLLHTNPFPVYMKSGQGHQVTSEDGKTYTDLTGEFTAALYGHSNPVILSAINEAMRSVGMNIGGTTAQERIFASELCKRFGLERIRFANSGTEANLHALQAAKIFTGKRKVVAFGGGYHGGVLGFAGGKPGSNNIDIYEWIVARYNDLEGAKRAIQSEGVAAVLLEGMQGAGGCICGSPEFLRGVEQAANEAGVLVILDEVMTSRMSTGGLGNLYNLKPDLKTFGKYLGGGLAFGAFGGRADIMATFDPRLAGCISHSGTFNNNTLVTHAGHAGLTKIFPPEVAQEFHESGERLRKKLDEVTAGTRMVFTGMGTVLTVHFPSNGSRDIQRSEDIDEIPGLKDLFWFEMLLEGFWIPRRGLVALILVTPQEELDRLLTAVQRFICKYQEFLAI